MQTDNNTKLRREVNEKDTEAKSGLEKVSRDLAELKAAVDSLVATVSELERNRGTGGSSTALVPGNLAQPLFTFFCSFAPCHPTFRKSYADV